MVVLRAKILRYWVWVTFNSLIMRKVILILLVCCSTIWTIHAQTLSNSQRNSYFTYVYRLSAKEVKGLISYNFDENLLLNRQAIDSFKTNSSYCRDLPIGNYLFLKAEGDNLEYQLINKSNLRAEATDNGRDLLIYVIENENGKGVQDAEVFVNKKVICYDKTQGVYLLTNSNRQGTLTIIKNSDTAFYELHREIYNSGFQRVLRKISYTKPIYYLVYPFRTLYWGIRQYGLGFGITHLFNSHRYSDGNEGFITFNKPKYLPGDTVKWKAFILNKNHRPSKNEIIATICARYSGKEKEIARLWPQTKGAYVHEFVLKDSLKINSWYNLQLKKKAGKKTLLQGAFYLEDYQLDETTYTLNSTENKYYFGDSLIFIVTGKDANGMNLLDSEVEMKVNPEEVHQYLDTKVFIPDKIWSSSKVLEPSGETRFSMPSNNLPCANLDLTVVATFRNSNNEVHKESKIVSFMGSKQSIKARLDSNMLVAEYLENGIPVSASGWLTAFYKSDTLFKRAVNFPLSEPFIESVTRYCFTAKTAKTELELVENKSLVDINYFRTKDSLHIEVLNPRKLEFRYCIYRGKAEKYLEGIARELKWTNQDPGKDSYFIELNYLWNGEAEKESRSIHFYENNLNVAIDQPVNVYPGEKVKVKVKVTDFQSNPVQNVNLTANAVNAQFKNIEPPDVPYLGKGHRELPVFNHFFIERPEVKRSYPLRKSWAEKMHLSTNPYYRIHFPDSFMSVLYDSLKSTSAQFAPYVFNNGRRQTVYLVVLDKEPLYYYDLSPTGPYSFKGEAGFHTIRLRLWDREIRIDSVLLKVGQKLELSLELSKIPASMVIMKVRWQLDQTDVDKLNRKVMFLNDNFRNHFAYLWQKDNVVYLSGHTSWNYLAGFFDYDSIHFALKDGFQTDFFFEPGYEYTIDNKLIKMRSKDHNLISGRLSYISLFPPFGEKALEISDIQFKSKPQKQNYLYEINPKSTTRGNGTFLLDYSGDSLVTRVVIYSSKGDFNPRFYKGRPSKYYDLPPGYYNFLFQTESLNYLQLDSVCIIANGLLFQRLSDLKSNTLQKSTRDSLLKYESNWTKEIPIKQVGVEKTYSSNYTGGGKGALKGKVLDKVTKEPIPFANIILESGEDIMGGTTSDFDGNFTIKPITPGKYDLKVTFLGYNTVIVTGIVVNLDKITFFDVEMESTTASLDAVYCIAYKVPLISRDRTSTSGFVSISEIAKMPNRSADAIATTVGGVFSADGERGSVRGQRSEGTVMYIDGIRVRGSYSLPDENSWSAETPEIPFSSIRSNFNDCGYWVPNLITDKNGEATFDVKFPDNITTWKSWTLAINDKKQSGYGYTETKSRKSLVANLALPRFLIQGDNCNIVGKSLNYTLKPQQIKTEFRLNKQLLKTRELSLDKVYIDTLMISPGNQDSVSLQYSLSRPDGYYDGEERKISVFKVGVEEAKGEFHVLNNDTTITIDLADDAKEISVYAQDNILETMLKELDYLKDYPYWCMEQTASKLKAYLLERKIASRLGQKFKHEGEIRKLVTKLERGQNDNGSWGWWDHSNPNIWMSAYVMEVLSAANAMGIRISFLEKGAEFLLNHRNQASKDELLKVLNTLMLIKAEFPVANDIIKLQRDSLNIFQKLQVLRLKQMTGLQVDIKEVLSMKKQSVFGSYYWGEESDPWFNNITNSTLMAYHIIEASDSLHPALQAIGNYFLELKSAKKWHNTIITAEILSTILPLQLKNTTKIKSTISVELSGAVNQSFTKFPMSFSFETQSSKLIVHKSGNGPLFITAFSKSWNSHPEKVDSIFDVKSWFEVNHVRIDSLKAGEESELVVEVNIMKAADYCMLEVPIPAGCSYGDNANSGNYEEVHREYFKHKTSIFCEHVRMGKHIYRIKLQPRFSGIYTLNPVKFEQMYFPIIFGRDEIKKSRIY